MICTPEYVVKLCHQARTGDIVAAETLCDCFRPEIRKAAQQVNCWDKETVEQEIRDEFIFIVMNFGPQKD